MRRVRRQTDRHQPLAVVPQKRQKHLCRMLGGIIPDHKAEIPVTHLNQMIPFTDLAATNAFFL